MCIIEFHFILNVTAGAVVLKRLSSTVKLSNFAILVCFEISSTPLCLTFIWEVVNVCLPPTVMHVDIFMGRDFERGVWRNRIIFFFIIMPHDTLQTIWMQNLSDCHVEILLSQHTTYLNMPNSGFLSFDQTIHKTGASVFQMVYIIMGADE